MSKRTILTALLLLAGAAMVLRGEPAPRNPSPDPGERASFERAESLFAEGSYALALEQYRRLVEAGLTAEQSRWVAFRIADATWRSAASTDQPDPSALEQARAALEQLVRDVTRTEDRDHVWAEIQESLGDFHWTRREVRNWGQAWSHYQQALDWWAGSTDIAEARDRYLGIVWKCARPPRPGPYYAYGALGNQLPLPVLENTLRIATTTADRARASYLLAMTLRNQSGDPARHARTAEAFEAAIETGRKTDWYDDALYHYAQWQTSRGRIERLPDGTRRFQPDFVRALELYRRLLSSYRKGETRYFDDAQRQVKNIVEPSVGIAVSNFFLPGSEVAYHLHWRNHAEISLALYRVDLTRDVELGAYDRHHVWLQKIELDSAERVHVWNWPTGDRGDHLPGQTQLTLDRKLAPGAYVIEARAGGQTARDLVLVTQASLLLKSSGQQALVYLCDSIAGAPRADGRVTLWAGRGEGRKIHWQRRSARTDADGLAVFELPAEAGSLQLFAAAADGEHQTFALGETWWGAHREAQWKIYAFTDRPAYRPGETVHFKFVARQYDGSIYSTPGDRVVSYEITDSRGAKVSEGSLRLNRFGGAWADLSLNEEMPLGEYRVGFRDPARNDDWIGMATLFRLEEYKLPEFRVQVETPRDGQTVKTFRVGETIEAVVRAEYYFGGPVVGATVEVLVYQRPLRVWWQRWRAYPWYYEDIDIGHHGWGGAGQIIKRETIRTDADGAARISFDSPRDLNQDYEFTVEARVTDASRREIVGRGKVQASRQRYFAFLEPEHNLYRPGDTVRVRIKTVDAGGQPVSEPGRLVVTRDRWVEVWLDPQGREVRGDRLQRLRRRREDFPPAPQYPGAPAWRLKFRGYEQEQILERNLRTDEQGMAEMEFRTPSEGYYRVGWTADEDQDFPVRQETTVWVADRDSRDLGFRPGGVQIVVDKDTARAGERFPVMLTAHAADRWVLFSVEADDLYSYRLVHLTGNVKLLELELDERHVPNVFLEAAMVDDGELYRDSRQVVVPPVRQFLDVAVTADRDVYEPRQEGTLTVTTRDHLGRPVSAEVALALFDESVLYIQQDYAGDPRQFFFGHKRPRQVRTLGSFNQKRLAGLEQDEDVAGVVVSDLPLGTAVQRKEYARSELQAAPGVADAVQEEALAEGAGLRQVAAEPGAEPAVEVRSDFRATALWQPDVVTDEDGRASISVKLPDSLTTWQASARAVGVDSRFGIASTSTRTRKPLIVRLQAPRFFVVGDEVTVSAVVNNNTDGSLNVSVRLAADGLDAERGGDTTLTVPAGGESRVDWTVAAGQAGVARLRVEARTTQYADAMERSYSVHEHGVEKLIVRAGKARADDVRVRLELPRERRAGSTSMTVQVTPSLAVTMLDALPYLIDYPYGCTEQTMSRFLPAAISARTLERLGLSRQLVATRIFGGIEREHAEQTHPDGRRSLAELDRMVRRGLQRLYDFQHADGGWGWWKEGSSDHWMTAYVVWGLGLARDGAIDVREDVLRRAAEYLRKELVEEEQRLDLQSFMLHALTASDLPGRGKFEAQAFDNLWQRRTELNAYSRALLALSAHRLGDRARAETLLRNLANGVIRDATPDRSVVVSGSGSRADHVIGTAHWGSDGLWWRWADGPVESTAFALRALLQIDPDHELVEPVVNWLIKNRRGAQWSNTRDTAIAVLTLGDYLERSGELASTLDYEVRVNGRSIARHRVRPDDLLGAPSRVPVDSGLLRDGANEIDIRRTAGDGPLYFSIETAYFSLEEPVSPAGNEIFARRDYARLVGQPTLLKGWVYEKRPLSDGASVVSGERIEVVLTIEAKNDYEYLVFEDLKPAGLEAVQLRSGAPVYAREIKATAHHTAPGRRESRDFTGRQRWVYQELRDRKVVLFLDQLPQGVWEIRYELRAEAPGSFHGLPVLGHAMYVPEIRCNGAELRIRIEDRPDRGDGV